MTSMNKPSTGAIPEDPMERMIVTLSGMSSAERKRCKARSIKFPTKLMYVLECGEYDDAITWDPTGLSFIIINPKAFEKRVLPEIFKEAKFASFQRKLMRWRFVKKGKVCSSVYTHPDFQRGNWTRCALMTSDKKRNMHESILLQQRLQQLRQQSDVLVNQQNHTLSSLSSTMAPSQQLSSIPSVATLASLIPRNVSAPSLADIPSTSMSDASSVFHKADSALSSHQISALQQGLDSFGYGYTQNNMARSVSPYLALGSSSLGNTGSLFSAGEDKFDSLLERMMVNSSAQRTAGFMGLTSPTNTSSLLSTQQNLRLINNALSFPSEGDILKNAYETLHRSL